MPRQMSYGSDRFWFLSYYSLEVLLYARTLPWELRKNLHVEPYQLIHLILYRPQEDLSDSCCLELDQFFNALSRCSNGQALA